MATGDRVARLARLRTGAAGGLAAASCALVVAAASAAYAREEIADSGAFADRAVLALERDEVRSLLVSVMTADLLERGSADLLSYRELLSYRPFLESALDVVIDTRPFKQIFRRAVVEAHAFVTRRDAESAVLDLADAGTLVLPAVRSISPEAASRLPPDLGPRLAALRQPDLGVDLVRVSEQVRRLGVVLPGLAAAAIVLSLTISPDRRRAAMWCALAVTGSGIVLYAGLTLALGRAAIGGTEGLVTVSDEEATEALRAALHVLVDDLRGIAIYLAGVGVVVGAAAASLLELGAPAGIWLRRVLGSPASRRERAARGAVALGFGVLAVWSPRQAVELAALAAGALLGLFGLTELMAATGGRTGGEAAPPSPPSRRTFLVALVSFVALVGGGAAAVALTYGEDAEELLAERELRPGCLGSETLCDRRLNEVVLAGTHNSMSAADEPGWALANQRHGIERQLRDGIRLLLLDVHYGVRDAAGNVRTDLRAEGRNANRVISALEPAELEALERLGTRLRFGEPTGARGLYLCHSLCELGATPLSTTLGQLRRFLEAAPGEILVLLLESNVPDRELEHAFDQAGLLPFIALLDRDEPLPTIGELIAAGTRMVVFLEQQPSGEVPWLHEAFSFVQDTPLGAESTRSCASSRGSSDSPLFMLNHWVDRQPPPVGENRRVQTRTALLDRIRRCERERGLLPTLIAVDHYDQGELLAVVGELNDSRTPD